MTAVSVFGFDDSFDYQVALVTSVAMMTMWTGALAFLPALIAIVLAEIFGWRSVLYYLLAGGLIGLLAAQAAGLHGNLDFADRRTVILLAAGFVGGFVYWLIAGRLAGARQPSASQSGPA